MEKLDQLILRSIADGNALKGHRDEVRLLLAKKPKSIVILDDDPTGTQTLQQVPVLTSWALPELEKELQHSPVFFILTNSRSLQAKEAQQLAKTLGQRLKMLSEKHKKEVVVISRSDSTLRGHYPIEVNALAQGLGSPRAKHFFIPAFFEGGRYTCGDVHYVADNGSFVPAAKTPFAKDSTFGYASSNLKDYLVEKHGASLTKEQVRSVSIGELRNDSPAELAKKIGANDNSHVIVNATALADLEKFVVATWELNVPVIYRTAASFLNAITAQRPAPLLQKEDIGGPRNTNGILSVIGSYVPKTTSQLHYLKAHYNATFLEFDVQGLFDKTEWEADLQEKAKMVDNMLSQGTNVVVYTSREVKTGSTKEESLKIVNRVSMALTALIGRLVVQPRAILAKGGITSSDIAVKSLAIGRATVLGQIAKGVPVWRADQQSKFPGLPYVVFPGNVGNDALLHTVLKSME
ncbi:four-carbon acid sugar kinase family protein [Maribacter sp. 2307ULW6-5]|uniref:four-carbon acid sugar kinase family protein n=1 Tax=Maribacter sp. 2307ULW6-5 TaxID=3386275 RepID=UPI0039BCF3C9